MARGRKQSAATSPGTVLRARAAATRAFCGADRCTARISDARSTPRKLVAHHRLRYNLAPLSVEGSLAKWRPVQHRRGHRVAAFTPRAYTSLRTIPPHSRTVLKRLTLWPQHSPVLNSRCARSGPSRIGLRGGSCDRRDRCTDPQTAGGVIAFSLLESRELARRVNAQRPLGLVRASRCCNDCFWTPTGEQSRCSLISRQTRKYSVGSRPRPACTASCILQRAISPHAAWHCSLKTGGRALRSWKFLNPRHHMCG